jgi:hypothetical protein
MPLIKKENDSCTTVVQGLRDMGWNPPHETHVSRVVHNSYTVIVQQSLQKKIKSHIFVKLDYILDSDVTFYWYCVVLLAEMNQKLPIFTFPSHFRKLQR